MPYTLNPFTGELDFYRGTPALHAGTHEDGGVDEIDVAGLSGLLADDQNPLPHAADHENGGGDEIDVTGLSGLLADPQIPLPHAPLHENGGVDEIDVGGLSGLLADPQVSLAHKDTHDPQTGGDPLDCAAPPANITPEQANAEGAADTLARSDHMHNLPSGAPSTVGLANAEGAAAAFARQDHIHQREHAKYTNAEAKAAAIAGWTASRALQVSAGGAIQVSPVTLAELNYLDGVTSAIQAQLGSNKILAMMGV